MKFTMTKIAAAAALAFAASSALAAPQAFTNNGAANFTMYDPAKAVAGNFNDISGFVDYAAMTFGVSSPSPFFGLNWTASGGTLFGPGTYNISTADATGASGGTYNNVVVGANQMGGNIKFAWGATTNIDVVMVWDLIDNGNGTMNFVSTDIDGNGVAGIGMIDGPFPGFSANFNFAAPVPEASTYGMMLAGLGLVGFAVRRRKLMA